MFFSPSSSSRQVCFLLFLLFYIILELAFGGFPFFPFFHSLFRDPLPPFHSRSHSLRFLNLLIMPLFSKFKRWQKPKDSSSTFSGDSSEFNPGSVASSSSPATSFMPVPPHIESPTYKVYLKYDVATPPPRPAGENWTRFVCISDTYGENFAVPSGDVLLHAGNLTASGKLHEFKQMLEWLYSLDHTVKV